MVSLSAVLITFSHKDPKYFAKFLKQWRIPEYQFRMQKERKCHRAIIWDVVKKWRLHQHVLCQVLTFLGQSQAKGQAKDNVGLHVILARGTRLLAELVQAGWGEGYTRVGAPPDHNPATFTPYKSTCAGASCAGQRSEGLLPHGNQR